MDIQANMTYEEQTPDIKQRWMALSQFVPLAPDGDAHDQATPPPSKSPGRIIRTNAFDDAEGFANLYERLSRMNHRCQANALRVAGFNHAVRVVAARPIDVGEEICISYLDAPHPDAPRPRRLVRDGSQGVPATCGNMACRVPLQPPLRLCARCKKVAYCSKDCQTSAWRANHKRECAASVQSDEALGAHMDTTGGLPVAKRRDYLRKNYGFLCDCELCKRECCA